MKQMPSPQAIQPMSAIVNIMESADAMTAAVGFDSSPALWL